MSKLVAVEMSVGQWEAVCSCLGAIEAAGSEADVTEAQGDRNQQRLFLARVGSAHVRILKALEPKGAVEAER